MYQALSTNQGKAFTKRLIPWPKLLDGYQNVTNDANKISTIIDKMYPEEKELSLQTKPKE